MINCNGTLLLVNHRLTDAQLNTVAALTVQRRTCSQIAEVLRCARADVVSAQRAIANAIPARPLTADDRERVRTLTLERLSSVVQAILLTMNLREVKHVRAELGLAGRVRHHQLCTNSLKDIRFVKNFNKICPLTALKEEYDQLKC